MSVLLTKKQFVASCITILSLYIIVVFCTLYYLPLEEKSDNISYKHLEGDYVLQFIIKKPDGGLRILPISFYEGQQYWAFYLCDSDKSDIIREHGIELELHNTQVSCSKITTRGT